jgi:hypothetical protein
MKPRPLFMVVLCLVTGLVVFGCDLFLPAVSDEEAAQAVSKMLSSTSNTSFSGALSPSIKTIDATQTIDGSEGGTCTVSITTNVDGSMSATLTYSDFGFRDPDTDKVYFVNGTETIGTGIPDITMDSLIPPMTWTFDMSGSIAGDLTIRTDGTKDTDVSIELTYSFSQIMTFDPSGVLVAPSSITQNMTGTINGVSVDEIFTIDLTTL